MVAARIKTCPRYCFSGHGLEKQKRLLAKLLNKNQLDVNLSEMDDEQFKVSEKDKELNK